MTFPIKYLILGLMLCALSARATIISVTITVTNSPTTNGQNYVVNGDTRTWTNNVILANSQIATNATIAGATSNMILQARSSPFSGFLGAVAVSTNAMKLTVADTDAPGTPTVSISGNWGKYSIDTSGTNSRKALLYPRSGVSLAEQTNAASALVDYLMNPADTNISLLQFPLDQITNSGSAGYSNAMAFVIAPTNTPSDNQVVIRTGDKNKWDDAAPQATHATNADFVSGTLTNSISGNAATANTATTATTATYTTGNNSALTNGVYSTNAIYPYSTFASASNQITLNNTYWLLSVSTGFAITNAIGQSAGNGTWATLFASNSAGSSVTGYVTIPAVRAIGTATTNALIVPAGKVGVFGFLSLGSLLTNYWNAVQQ